MSEFQDFSAPSASPVKKRPPQKTTGAGGKAIASLILGLLSCVLMCFTAVPGLILGIMGLSDAKKGITNGKGLSIAGIVLSSLGLLWTVPVILVAVLLPAVQATRTAARQNVSANNIRQQSLAMLNYESARMKFPLRDRNGLSWRVHILPYISQENARLYDQFHQDEPWDSPHNIQLLPEMPACFDSPNAITQPGFTVYQVPYTNASNQYQAVFDDRETNGARMRSISDGTSNTILILEVNSDAAVEWTKPADWKFDPSNPMRDLGDLNPGKISFGFVDGSTYKIPTDMAAENFKAMITRNDGQAINRDF